MFRIRATSKTSLKVGVLSMSQYKYLFSSQISGVSRPLLVLWPVADRVRDVLRRMLTRLLAEILRAIEGLISGSSAVQDRQKHSILRYI